METIDVLTAAARNAAEADLPALAAIAALRLRAEPST
jgi:hypothetical protein